MPVLSILVWALPSPLVANDWPAWRGPTGQGISAETDLPLEWGSKRNVRWKSPLPEPGNSTPIIWGERVFLTQAESRGRKRMILCFDRRDGKVLWKKVVDYEEREPTHKTNGYCSASPATDGERVVVFHGSAGVYCYDVDGRELWRRDLGEFRHIWGNAASPVIHGDLCYLNCGPGPRTFLIALDKRSGKTVWKRDIPGGRESGDSKTWTGSWSTPLIIRDGEKDNLIISYPGRLLSVDRKTGADIWTCTGLGKLVYTSPIARDGIVVAMSGFMGPPMAVRTGGSGDVTATHRLWRQDRSPQRIGSGVILAGRIYIVNDSGVAQCIEARTGKEVWKHRLSSNSWSSVVLSGDRLYAADKRGNFFVLRAAPKFELLAENSLGEPTCASIAVSNGELFIRTFENLWCISKKSSR